MTLPVCVPLQVLSNTKCECLLPSISKVCCRQVAPAHALSVWSGKDGTPPVVHICLMCYLEKQRVPHDWLCCCKSLCLVAESFGGKDGCDFQPIWMPFIQSTIVNASMANMSSLSMLVAMYCAPTCCKVHMVAFTGQATTTNLCSTCIATYSDKCSCICLLACMHVRM